MRPQPKRPESIFDGIALLPEPGKRALFALLWRDYPKLLRQVGDELGIDGDDPPAPVAHAMLRRLRRRADGEQ
jgi:hypothetical protein